MADLIDTGFGTVLLAGRAARGGASLVVAPVGVLYRSRLGGPLRSVVDGVRTEGAEARPEFIAWVQEQIESLTSALFGGPLLAIAIRSAAGNVELESWVREQLEGPQVERLVRAIAADPRLEPLVREFVASPGVEALLREFAASPGVEALLRELAASPRIEAAIREFLASPSAEGALRELGASPRVEALVRDALLSPRLDRWVDEALGSKRLEQLLLPIFDSRLALDFTDRLIASEEMQRLLHAIATSPEIRTALAEQSMGVAGELTTGVRDRSVSLDDAVEQRVRAWLRRPSGERRNGEDGDRT